jgi:alpha 1,6-mannosyltransferase
MYALTDRYLLARYQVPWQHLRGRRTPLRIGEVMILPITAFSPNGEPDFGAETDKSPQCDLVHLCEFAT